MNEQQLRASEPSRFLTEIPSELTQRLRKDLDEPQLVELAKELLRRKPALRILFISGHVGSEVIRFYGMRTSDQHFFCSMASCMWDSARMATNSRTTAG